MSGWTTNGLPALLGAAMTGAELIAADTQLASGVTPQSAALSSLELSKFLRGQAQNGPNFRNFTTPEYGIRALAKTLMTYSRVHGCGTVRALIDRFAPPSENDTQAYVAAVSESCGVPPDTPIDLADPMMMGRLVEAVIRQENGRQPYTPAQISAGLALAGLPPLVAPGVADAI